MSLCFTKLIYAQKRKLFKSYKECQDNFKVGSALSGLPAEARSWSTIGNYLACTAIAQQNASPCANLYGSDGQICVSRFNEVRFYSLLYLEKKITPEVLQYCPSGKDMKFCKQIATAIITKDASLCPGNDNDCKATVRLDVDSAVLPGTKDSIYLIKAIKEDDINNCLKIKDNDVRIGCRAYIARDAKICNEDKLFKKLRDTYCQSCTQ